MNLDASRDSRLDHVRRRSQNSSYKTLGNSVPWSVTLLTDGRRRLKVDVNFKNSPSLDRIVNCLTARINAPVVLEYSTLYEGRPLISPSHQFPAYSPRVEQALRAVLQLPVPSKPTGTTNITEVTLPYQISDKVMPQIIQPLLKRTDAFVTYRPTSSGSRKTPAKTYIEAADNLALALGLLNISIDKTSQAITIRVLPCEKRSSFKDVAMFLAVIETTASLSQIPVHIERPSDYEDMYEAIVQFVGDEIDWDLQSGRDGTCLLTRQPEKVPEEALENFRVLFGCELSIQRNPEPLWGTWIPAPLEGERHT